jgi:hypothetical protein
MDDVKRYLEILVELKSRIITCRKQYKYYME